LHLFEATERIASFDWNTTTVQQHLRELSASMADEVTFLTGLDGLEWAGAGGPAGRSTGLHT
jgi:hypothetical protein